MGAMACGVADPAECLSDAQPAAATDIMECGKRRSVQPVAQRHPARGTGGAARRKVTPHG